MCTVPALGQGDEHSDQETETRQMSVTFNRSTIKTQNKMFKHLKQNVQTFKQDQNYQTATDCHNTYMATGLRTFKHFPILDDTFSHPR